jgi:hypothetical protein
VVDRYELDRRLRSLAMLTPRQMALNREDAMARVEELAATEERLCRIRDGLRRLLADLERRDEIGAAMLPASSAGRAE